MKKLATLSLAVVFAASVFSGTAIANHGRDPQSLQCLFNATGPAAQAGCKVKQVVSVKCQNNNYVDIGQTVYQNGQSGAVVVEYNTQAGGGTSGDITNINTTQLTVKIDNACAAKKKEDQHNGGPTKDKKPSQPEAPQAEKAAELPVTDGTSPAVLAATAALSLGIAALAVRLGFSAYARFKA